MSPLRLLLLCIFVVFFLVFTIVIYQVAFIVTANDEELGLSNSVANLKIRLGENKHSLQEFDRNRITGEELIRSASTPSYLRKSTRRRTSVLDQLYAGPTCTHRQQCPSSRMLCVEGRCLCPVIYTGADCWEPSAHVGLTSELGLAPGLNPGTPWCGLPFSEDSVFPYNPSWSGHMRRAILMQAVKNRSGDLHQAGDFTTCAVVGSAGRLLDAAHGAEIDGHTAVFRFNDAPARGFERHVGLKTTVRVQNIEYCGYKERDGEVLLHYTDPRRSHFARCTDTDIRKISPRMLFYSQNYFIRTRPPPPLDPSGGKVKMSGGFYGVMLALHVCGKVKLFGFGQTQDHYYVKGKKHIGATPFQARHAWTYEQRCLRQLVNSPFNRVSSDISL